MKSPEVQGAFEGAFEGQFGVRSGPCPICGGTRWEIVEQVVNGKVIRAAKRCRCWAPAARIVPQTKVRHDRQAIVAQKRCKAQPGVPGEGERKDVDWKTLASGEKEG